MAGDNGKTQIVLWVGVIGPVAALLVTLGGLVYWTAGVANDVKTLTVTVQSLRSDIDQSQGELSRLRLDLATQKTALNEVETQFCANDIVRNLMHANDLRTIRILWEKQFGQTFPTDNTYYPMICNRKMP